MSRLWSRGDSLDVAARAMLLVLDIDGVLLDPRPSFYSAACSTAVWAARRILQREVGPGPTDEHIAAFKAVGGWNDDFDLACGLTWGLVVREAGQPRFTVSETAERVGGGLPALNRLLREIAAEPLRSHAAAVAPFALIRARTAAFYAGANRCHAMYGINPADHEGLGAEGLWSTELTLCEQSTLSRWTRPLAFFTGRNPAEAALALERFSLSIPVERQIVDDGRTPRKPSPAGLLRLAQGVAGPFVFVGDSIDDQHAFVRVTTDLEGARKDGADIVVPSLDVLLEAL
jgi:phosphoglycolate phosphatase-like HAD superfamily hydrolase